MKLLNLILTASILVVASYSQSTASEKTDDKLNNVAPAPLASVTEDIAIPVNLKYVKAKSALVPVAQFIWGDPDAALSLNSLVPVAPAVTKADLNEAPLSLQFVKAKNALVPVAPIVMTDADDQAPVL